jgi:signal transduction histidine kinase
MICCTHQDLDYQSAAELLRFTGTLLLGANACKSSALTSSISHIIHELRTPLNAINGFTDLLKAKCCTTQEASAQQYLQCIHSSTMHMMHLVNNILDFAKLANKHMHLERNYYHLQPIIQWVIEIIEPLAKHKDVNIVYDTGLEPIYAYMDQMRIKQALLNLLSNAIKFTPKHSSIGIEAYASQSSLIIRVWDEGPGITPSDYAHVFEPFKQVNSAQNGDYNQRGTGLGLSITKHLIDLHGGSITIDPHNCQGGCCFTITIDQALCS